MNSDGNVEQIRKRAKKADILVAKSKKTVVEGWFEKPKGVAHITCKRGFIGIGGKLANGKNELERFIIKGPRH